MTRQVLALDLKDDPLAIETYRAYHREVWPEVAESLRTVGIEQMEIHQLGRRLVMIVETRDGVDLRSAFAAHRVSSPRVAEWERLMQLLQEPLADAAQGEWWAAMTPVFRLEEQLTPVE
jgi:L-rhamnose mutarotase